MDATKPMQMPMFDETILLQQYKPSQTYMSTPVKQTSTMDRIMYAYILLVLVIILMFAVPIETQKKYQLDITYKIVGIVSAAYIAYLTISKDICK